MSSGACAATDRDSRLAREEVEDAVLLFREAQERPRLVLKLEREGRAQLERVGEQAFDQADAAPPWGPHLRPPRPVAEDRFDSRVQGLQVAAVDDDVARGVWLQT